MSMLGFTFITDSKLSMYREKAIKSETLAKEVEEMQDMAFIYEKRIEEKNKEISNLKSDIASKDKEILSVGKDLSVAKEEIERLNNNQKKLIKSIKDKTEKLEEANSKLGNANYRISDLEEKRSKISSDLKKKSNDLVEAKIKIGNLENEVLVGSKTIQDLESKLKLTQVELRGYQIGIIGKDKNNVAEPELDKDEESDKYVAEPEKFDENKEVKYNTLLDTDVIQEEVGDIVDPENVAEQVKDTKKKKKKRSELF